MSRHPARGVEIRGALSGLARVGTAGGYTIRSTLSENGDIPSSLGWRVDPWLVQGRLIAWSRRGSFLTQCFQLLGEAVGYWCRWEGLEAAALRLVSQLMSAMSAGANQEYYSNEMLRVRGM